MQRWMKSALSVLVMPITAAAEISFENIDQAASELQPQVVEWRRWFHQNPELSNREFNTSARIAEILEEMGLEPRTGIAHTGVMAIIEGGKPGPLVAIRADMDGLPVTEQTGLPFASTVMTEFNGQQTGVMHACGHDAHMAMALGATKLLNDMKDELAGSVMVIFQPAEEGAPVGELGGAKLMLEEGLFDQGVPEAVFGIHVGLGAPPRRVDHQARADDGLGGPLVHESHRSSNARGEALGRCGSDCCVFPDHHGVPDHRQSPG